METNESLNKTCYHAPHKLHFFPCLLLGSALQRLLFVCWLEKQDFSGWVWACSAYGSVLTHSLPCEEIVRTKEL